MEWYVYRYDFNKREIVPFNVFRHADFKEDVEEIDIKNISYKDFKNQLDKLTLYYFWSKCEYEVVITSWPPFITKEDLAAGLNATVLICGGPGMAYSALALDLFDQYTAEQYLQFPFERPIVDNGSRGV